MQPAGLAESIPNNHPKETEEIPNTATYQGRSYSVKPRATANDLNDYEYSCCERECVAAYLYFLCCLNDCKPV